MTSHDRDKNALFFQEIQRLVVSLDQGRLDQRTSVEGFSGPWRETLETTNSVLERFDTAIESIAAIIQRMAQGDIPDRIQNISAGKFGHITENLNLLIHRMNQIAITSVLIASGTIDNLELKEYSANDRIVKAFNLMVKRLRDLLGIIDLLISGIKQGDFQVRGDTSRFSGVWKDLVITVNELMEQLLSSLHQTRQSEEKFRNLFEYSPDGILITGFDGRVIAFNRAAMSLFGYTDAREFSMLTAHRFYLNPETDRPYIVDHVRREGFLENHTVVFKNRLNVSFFASLSLREICYEGQTCIQTTVRDVSNIIAMEEQLRDYADNLEQMVEKQTRHLALTNRNLSQAVTSLEETREQLAKQSFEAGMAEMAVSVLHNIGNAITPVNIRIGSMIDSVGIPREISAGLESILEIMESGKALTDRQHQTVVKLLSSISRSIPALNEATEKNLLFVQKNVEHIKEIISRQQRYAGVYGVDSLVDINDLLDDTVEMLKDSIEKRNITVRFDKGDLPRILLDKNKMVQIFVNIVKNAYEAIDMDSSGTAGTIILKTRPHSIDGRFFARITCQDSGIGLDPEKKNRLFTFNFSTKSRVSGFGLHDCANYLRARGGDIDIESQGRHMGATVTVDLRYARDKL